MVNNSAKCESVSPGAAEIVHSDATIAGGHLAAPGLKSGQTTQFDGGHAEMMSKG